jgi:hypothetical protein
MRAMGLDGEARRRLMAMDMTATIGGSVGRILRQPVVTLSAGLIPHADYGLRTPADLAGLRAAPDGKASARNGILPPEAKAGAAASYLFF